jgi:hypothetical protein
MTEESCSILNAKAAAPSPGALYLNVPWAGLTHFVVGLVYQRPSTPVSIQEILAIWHGGGGLARHVLKART